MTRGKAGGPRRVSPLNLPSPRQAAMAREHFAAIAAGPDEAVDIALGALWLAAESCELDVEAARRRIDELADSVATELTANMSLEERVQALNRALFVTWDFQGERVDYYDARNSFLNFVLERRRGIPIALCVLYITVARHQGLHADGVSFPGHFLAKVSPQPANDPSETEVFIDAFEGQTLTRQECQKQLRDTFGPQAVLVPEMLQAASNKDILARMLSNLKSIFINTQQYEQALTCCDRALLLTPDAPLELRDRGLVYQRLDCVRPAVTDLERYLALAPEDPAGPAVRKLLDGLRRALPQVH